MTLPRFLCVLLSLLTQALPPVPACAHPMGTGLGAPAPDSVRSVERAPGFRADRFWGGAAAFVAADAAVLYGLSRMWYGGQERTAWHWYKWRTSWLDDWPTYVQQDKVGHLVTTWHLARIVGAYGRWSGLTPRQAGILGGAVSIIFQSQIEVLDGYSERYGASRTDLLANFVGGVIGGLQVADSRLGWFTSKYSYHRSPYYDEAQSYLGNALKDYDGISYWLVVRPERLLPERAAAWWPGWLALSAGYSGDGLAHPTSGFPAPGRSGPGPVHRRQLYIGLDLDLLAGHAEWPQPFRAIGGLLSFIRLPAPALELTPELRWHWLFH